MEETGYITVNVRTAGGYLPIDGAIITVRNEVGSIIAVMLSDMAGTSDILSLWAPPREASLSPGTSPVAAFYTLTTEKEGYYSVETSSVPIFSGERSVQNVILVPYAKGNTPIPEELTRFDTGTLPSL